MEKDKNERRDDEALKAARSLKYWILGSTLVILLALWMPFLIPYLAIGVAILIAIRFFLDPDIDTQQKSDLRDLAQFKAEFSSRSTEFLQAVIAGRSQYRAVAIEAARQVLEERGFDAR